MGDNGKSDQITTDLTTQELAARLRLSATRLARRLRTEAGSPLTPTQLSALAVIDRHGPLTLGALAERERVAPPTVTSVVAKLEAEALVARTSDPNDRRVTRVTTTSAGRHLLEEHRARKTSWLTTRLQNLEPEQRDRLADALDALDALTEQPG